jgi:hypothetical protein
MRKLVFPYYLLIITVIGCASSKIKSTQAESLPTENLQITDTLDFENKIVFLTIKITQTDSVKDTYSFKVTKTVIANGQLKRNPMATFVPEPNYLYCEILDDNKKRTDYIRVENPLLKVYEFNEKPGSPLNKRTFKTTQGEFNLRFQFDKNSKYLSVYKASPDYKTLKKIYNASISH